MKALCEREQLKKQKQQQIIHLRAAKNIWSAYIAKLFCSYFCCGLEDAATFAQSVCFSSWLLDCLRSYGLSSMTQPRMKSTRDWNYRGRTYDTLNFALLLTLVFSAYWRQKAQIQYLESLFQQTSLFLFDRYVQISCSRKGDGIESVKLLHYGTAQRAKTILIKKACAGKLHKTVLTQSTHLIPHIVRI